MTSASSSPERWGFVTLPPRRRVAVAEWGDQDGPPVVFHHGSPGSRRFCPDADVVSEIGVRLIGLDRPGYGGSDPIPNPTVVRVTEHLVGALDQLGVEEFVTVGWSGGSPYALACAAIAPHRVRATALVASPAPPDPDAMPPDPAAAEAWLEPYLAAPQRLIDHVLGPADLWVRRRGDVVYAFTQSLREGLRQGARGFADDESARHRPWGFDLAAVGAPVTVWHGDEDAETPVSQAHELVKRLPRCRLELVPRAGHWVALARWRDVLLSALSPEA